MIKTNKKGGMAIGQIILLLASIFAFSYILGGVGVVSASDHGTPERLTSWDGTIWLKDTEGMTCVSDDCSRKQHQTTIMGQPLFCGRYPYWCDERKTGEARITAETIARSPTYQTTDSDDSGGDGGTSGAVGTVTSVTGAVATVKTASDLLIPASKTQSTLAAAAGKGTVAATEIVVAGTASAASTAASEAASGLAASGYGFNVVELGATNAALDAGASASEAATLGTKAAQSALIIPTLTTGFAINTILVNAGIAAGIYTGVKILLSFTDASPELSNSIALASSLGYFVGSTLGTLGSAAGAPTWLAVFASGSAATGIGIAIAAVIFLATYSKTGYQVVSYSCYPWDAPVGGEFCGECDDGDFSCTTYRCRSLGQACVLENEGTSEEVCFWQSRNDINPPVIQPWEDILTPDYIYTPDNAISPPDRGVKIEREGTNGCIAPFTPLRFGITLDEPGKCKIDITRKDSYDEMNFFFGRSSTFKYNHSETMDIQSLDALEAAGIILENGGNFELYSRCRDANGNENVANFVFSFCVDEGPDTTPPLIVSTSPFFDGSPISFEQQSAELQVYVNEPAECRWGKIDQSYDDMGNQMSCETDILGGVVKNAQTVWQCSTTLTGLNDLVDNDFYFRCKDQPHLIGTENENDRNVNEESKKLTLVGTRPLVIDSAEPNSTVIKDSTNVIKVTLKAKTSAGYNEGVASCYYQGFGTNGEFNEFINTGDTHEHSQDLFLAEGSYDYNILCVDAGGNSDNVAISFGVETDTNAPVVVRIFHEENDLKIITNENATCVYSNNDCSYNFDDADSGTTKMSTLDDVTHSTDWDSENNFYIKCKDEFNNRPLPNSCSIIARPFQI